MPGRTALCVFLAVFAALVHAEDADCLKCHGALASKRYVHAAVQMGCTACHAELDAAVVPHKAKSGLAKGLAAEPPELCFRCHERSSFEGKVVHAPAAAGLCVACHDPHASDHVGLARKAGATLCLDCHPEVANKPHVVAGFSRRGHPLGDEPKSAAARDPLRPGKPFYCGTCHEPHRSSFARLTRFDAKSMTAFCVTCHRM